MSKVFAKLRRVLDGGYTIVVHRDARRCRRAESDPKPAGIDTDFLNESPIREGRPVRRTKVLTACGIQKASTVADRACYCMLDDQSSPVFSELRSKGVSGTRRF
jgi:hypothetical protein